MEMRAALGWLAGVACAVTLLLASWWLLFGLGPLGAPTLPDPGGRGTFVYAAVSVLFVGATAAVTAWHTVLVGRVLKSSRDAAAEARRQQELQLRPVVVAELAPAPGSTPSNPNWFELTEGGKLRLVLRNVGPGPAMGLNAVLAVGLTAAWAADHESKLRNVVVAASDVALGPGADYVVSHVGTDLCRQETDGQKVGRVFIHYRDVYENTYQSVLKFDFQVRNAGTKQLARLGAPKVTSFGREGLPNLAWIGNLDADLTAMD
jgi:hypothetical protein